MFPGNYIKTHEHVMGRDAIVASGLGEYNLADTMECGQCFRHVRLVGSGEDVYTESASAIERLSRGDYPQDYVEYLTVVSGRLVFVGQRRVGELIFFGSDDDLFDSVLVKYFSLDVDYNAIREEIKYRTDSDTLREYCDMARGVVLLRQEPWETVFSFIISSNNNIPRIRKIIRKICAEYGELILRESAGCPVFGGEVLPERCRECGICYSFPTPSDILSTPERLLISKPGFRYRYLVSAAELISCGEVNLEKIEKVGKYDFTVSELMKITGVGNKVASCAALFGFGNWEAFPIDVWIRRAIDEHFGGKLDIERLGEYAGIAQQYIFHSIRNLERKK